MPRIHDTTQVPTGWNQPHAKAQERMALAEQRGHFMDMNQDKVKEVAAALQKQEVASRQRAVEAGQLEPKLLGGKIDTFA